MSMNGHFHRISDQEIQAVLADPANVLPSAEWWEPSDRPHLDIDKAWHGLQFLLTGDDERADNPLNFITTGGTEVGDVDVGYGPARVFTSSEVRQIAAALDGISADHLRSRFDPQAMMAAFIYPAIWDRDPAEDDALEYLTSFWEPLKEFVTSAARDGSGLLVYLS